MADSNDQIPEGFIPDTAEQAVSSDDHIPEGFLPNEELDQAKYGTGEQMLKTAAEQGLSGATLGASKVLETQGIPQLGIPPITTPEDIAGRERANPVLATLSNIGGTAATLAGTGGLSGAVGAATAAGRITVGGLEGALIGGISAANDDWSQNKSLDGQKVVGSAGLGLLLGMTGAKLGEALRSRGIANVPKAVADRAAEASEDLDTSLAAPVNVVNNPEFTGIKPTSVQELADKTAELAASPDAMGLPQQGELDDAVSRIGLENPITPLQRDMLASKETQDAYLAGKDTPGISQVLNATEARQKAELVAKTGETIENIAPEAELTTDAYKAGKKSIDAFTDQYQTEKKALGPIFQEIRSLPVTGDILPESIARMTKEVPGIANMFDTGGEELNVLPYRTSWGIDKATYNAVKEAVESLSEGKPDLQTIWNVRKGMDQHVDVLAQGQAPQEIRSLKKALMDQMMESTDNPGIRSAFARYAINEQNRQVIEKTFGASVGTPEFGSISKVKPERILDKIFNDTATVDAAKNILGTDKFNELLANWLNIAKENVTDKGAFSSNKFNSFLRQNQYALQQSLRPDQFQRLKDLTTIMRILPDAPSGNPSGTAKTLMHMLDMKSMLSYLPKKGIEALKTAQTKRTLDKFLSGQALQNSQQAAVQARALQMTQKIDTGVKALFGGAAGQSKKVLYGQ